MHYYFVDQIERKILELLLIELLECGWPRKLDNLTWCKMPVKLT